MWWLSKYLSTYLQTAGYTTSNSQAQVDECARRRREREKARHAAMTQEERDEKNKKHWEKYLMRKAETALAAGPRGPPHSDFLFLNSVLPFLVYLMYSDVYVVNVYTLS